jgi:ribosomal-protein-alanine N-acetyltransferase
MSWLLRRAGLDDLDAIMRLETATFPSDAWSRDAMRSELASPHSYYLVAVSESQAAEHSDEIDGYAGLRAPISAQQADIQTIAVAPGARRSGLGKTLMRQLLTEARQRGAHEVFLEVRSDNPGAQALYEQLGFEQIAVRPHYYQPDDVDAVVMRHGIVEPTTSWAAGTDNGHHEH